MRAYLGSVFHPLVASVGKDCSFFPLHQCLRLGHILDVHSCADHDVHQSGIRSDANLRLHAEVPSVGFLRLVHLGVLFSAPVRGRTGRCNDGGVYGGPVPDVQATRPHQGINNLEKLPRQAIFLQ